MNEEANSNLLSEIVGSLVNNKGNVDSMYGGNFMWIIFFIFMMGWGGNGFGGFGFGNRNGMFGPPPATQNDIFASTAWGQTQDAIRDSIENTTNTTGRLSQDIAAGNANILQNINGLNNSVNQLGYNTLAQSNATNQQLARTGYDLQTAVMAGTNTLQQAANNTNQQIASTGYDLQTAVMAGNNMLQGAINAANQQLARTGYDLQTAVMAGTNTLQQSANNTNQQIARTGFDLQTAVMTGNNMLQGTIMAGNNMVNNAIRETAGDTKLTMCQGNSALQSLMQGVGNNLQMATYQTSNDTQRQIQNTGFGLQTTMLETANNTQRDIQSMNADSRLAVCQATNTLQNATNENGNRVTGAINNIGNSILQGITGLGFLTQQKGDELKFELAQSTCNITSNNTANTQKVLDKLCQIESSMQASKIQELQTANQALMLSNQVKDLQANQLATAGYIINQVNPQARPAWIVSSPYQSTTTTTTGG